MARIVYGVAGEGFGHSSRSELIGKRLMEAGHEVVFAASGKSLSYLQPSFEQQVREVYGLRFSYQDGAIRPIRTLWRNLAGCRKGLAVNKMLFSDLARHFRPDLVISDFEPFSAWWAWQNRIPCVSIDHEHLLTCCQIEPDVASWKDKTMGTIVTRGYHTFADAYVVLNFFKTPVMNKAARIVPPVIRESVLQMQPQDGEHILIYSTDPSENLRKYLLDVVSRFKSHRFYIYGFNVDREEGNCRFKKTSTQNFLRDLADCRAVVATAGFSLLSECLHFRKPMLLMPVRAQYEQAINAYYIEKLGMGQRTKKLTAEQFGGFLNKLDAFKFNHASAVMPDNESCFEQLDDTFRKVGFDLNLSAPIYN